MRVDKEKLIMYLIQKSINYVYDEGVGYDCAIKDIEDYIETEPTAQWIEIDSYKNADGFICYDYRCSTCGYEIQDLGDIYEAYDMYHYCPHCGIKMKEETQNE